MRKVELLPTRDCEAGYGPAKHCFSYERTYGIMLSDFFVI